MNKEEKKKIQNKAIEDIKKKFGDDSIMMFGEIQNTTVNCVSTGCLSLDIALGAGIPRGRITEIFGPESSGKTTLAQHIIAEVQKEGGSAAFIDAENAMDPEYARNIGVDVDKMFISQPSTGEEALEILENLVRSNTFDIIVVDSVAALVPKAELEGQMGDSHMALQARLMSQALRKLTGIISKTNTIVIFINQLRSKIGVFYGSPETTTGGNALKFYASIRIDIRRSAFIKFQDKDLIGSRTKAKIVKNKIAAPFKVAEFDIMYNEGISIAGDVLDVALTKNIITKAGNSYTYGEIKLGVGRNATITFLKENQELLKEIRQKLI